MNNDVHTLRQELEKVSLRYRRLRLLSGLAVGWLVLAMIGAAVLLWARRENFAIEELP